MTAFAVASAMDLPSQIKEALLYNVHPQERTRAFHKVFGAPIHNEISDTSMSHMTSQRLAFRASFILSEAIELLEKGFGLDVTIAVRSNDGEGIAYTAEGSDNAALSNAIEGAMLQRGTDGRNVVEVVDALGDLNVVVNGFALELGVDMREIDGEILASNLTKLDETGQPIVADGSDPRYPAGKILKSPNFVEPDIASVLGLD